MPQLCCIGHITSDKVVTTKAIKHMPGGTAYYFSCAVSKLDIDYLLVTALAPAEVHYVAALRDKDVEVQVLPSAHTVIFENIYGENQDERTQNVLDTADPFEAEQFTGIDAELFHLGPLLAGDIGVELIAALAAKGRVSIDVQGYLRRVENQKVYATGWPDKQAALSYAEIVKADVAELQALTGCETTEQGAQQLMEWGVKEVVVTNGSQGSEIFHDEKRYVIPAFRPREVVDATGCGDTYMAGYLFRRLKGDDIQRAGEFAAAMASLKMEASGPFLGTEDDVIDFMNQYIH
ncbi:MAG: PfkB family carbohydrate kinase [Bacteroidota bacterium]